MSINFDSIVKLDQSKAYPKIRIASNLGESQLQGSSALHSLVFTTGNKGEEGLTDPKS